MPCGGTTTCYYHHSATRSRLRDTKQARKGYNKRNELVHPHQRWFQIKHNQEIDHVRIETRRLRIFPLFFNVSGATVVELTTMGGQSQCQSTPSGHS